MVVLRTDDSRTLATRRCRLTIVRDGRTLSGHIVTPWFAWLLPEIRW